MSKVLTYPPGTFCWVDLTTPDIEKARAFYIRLLGWRTRDVPARDNLRYSLMLKHGYEVAAIVPQPPFLRDSPPMWNSYLCVKDVNEVTDRARQLGASVLSEAADVTNQGRMSVITDPGGARLMLWQPVKHTGAGIINEPGSLAWNELMTQDAERATEFYTQLFGWTHRTRKMPDGRSYHLFGNRGRDTAGMLEMSSEMDHLPTAWMVYFAVAHLDEALDRNDHLGGLKQFGPMTISNTGILAMISDAVGAYCYLIQLQQEPAPL